MKSLLIAMILFSSARVFAAVSFPSGSWSYGTSAKVVLQKVGIASDPNDITRLVLNFEDGGQAVLTGEHIKIGLALAGLQGKCITVIPGYQFKSIDLILNCD